VECWLDRMGHIAFNRSPAALWLLPSRMNVLDHMCGNVQVALELWFSKYAAEKGVQGEALLPLPADSDDYDPDDYLADLDGWEPDDFVVELAKISDNLQAESLMDGSPRGTPDGLVSPLTADRSGSKMTTTTSGMSKLKLQVGNSSMYTQSMVKDKEFKAPAVFELDDDSDSDSSDSNSDAFIHPPQVADGLPTPSATAEDVSKQPFQKRTLPSNASKSTSKPAGARRSIVIGGRGGSSVVRRKSSLKGTKKATTRMASLDARRSRRSLVPAAHCMANEESLQLANNPILKIFARGPRSSLRDPMSTPRKSARSVKSAPTF